jgi:aspartate aminotransferase-like enzyme
MKTPLNLLPGPVDVHPAVLAAGACASVSHRSQEFGGLLEDTRRCLRDLTGAPDAQIAVGTGTLANDMIACQLALQAAPGLILSNGEFGERLVDHAARAGLEFRILRAPWGKAFARSEIEGALDLHRAARWIWAVHCETSTGVLNDLESLSSLVFDRGLALCLDAVSSLGTVPLDLRGVHLASGVSGKGLGSLPGLCMVFARRIAPPAPRSLPRYLDLGLYAATGGVPFTGSSNLLRALHQALRRLRPARRFRDLAVTSHWLRQELQGRGIVVLARAAEASPAVLTIPCERGASAEAVGRKLESSGYLVHYRSEYLVRRNWIQVALMSGYSRARLRGLPAALDRALRPSPVPRLAFAAGRAAGQRRNLAEKRANHGADP